MTFETAKFEFATFLQKCLRVFSPKFKYSPPPPLSPVKDYNKCFKWENTSILPRKIYDSSENSLTV